MLALTLIALLSAGGSATPKPLGILFLGNSHTGSNDVPGMVKGLIEANGRRLTVTTRYLVGDLASLGGSSQAKSEIADGSYDYLVLQGAPMSSSHKFTYSQAGPIALAKAGLAAGMRVLLFAEWPRRGWKETGFILDIYGKTWQAANGSEILPIPQTWDRVLAKRPSLELWQPDGNHAALPGSFLAACVIADRIAGISKSTYVPPGLDPRLAAWLRDVAVTQPK